MKTLLKIIISIIGVITILVSIWCFYFWNKFSTLQELDRQIILNSFKKDSDLKGYSDDSKILLEQDFFEKDDFKLIYNNLEKKNFSFLSFDEIFDIQNQDMDEEKCKKIKKDIESKNKGSL